MNAETLARLQFGVTTIYHFLFVPVTLGLSLLVAMMQTAYYRTKNPEYKRMTKFFGKLFLINFAIGVVTGLVQEFQFGMNWSNYSRYVGDIFGAPLAMEGLLAFFLESTFIGLWIFGWDRLKPGLHLTTIWLAAIGTNISAFFILAANSWMQHPVGYVIDPVTKRPKLVDIWPVLFQKTTIWTFLHTFFGGFLIAGGIVVAASVWNLARKRDTWLFSRSLKAGAASMALAGLAVFIVGDQLAFVMTQQQPMKMAAAEAVWDTTTRAEFSLFAVGDVSTGRNTINLAIPGALSLLATHDINGTVQGINDLNAQYQKQFADRYGPDANYIPNVFISYWAWRLMIGAGFLAFLAGAFAWWRAHKQKDWAPKTWTYRVGVWIWVVPLAGAILGWIFTEMARQPWIVFGLMKTAEAVSPNVAGWTVLISLLVYALVYGVLAVIEGGLMVATVRKGPEPFVPDQDPETADERPLTFAY